MDGSRVPEPRGRESGMALLRALAAGYLIYLGVTMILDRITGRSEMPLWLSWTCGVIFVLAGAVFGWYAWKRYRREITKKLMDPKKHLQKKKKEESRVTVCRYRSGDLGSQTAARL